jgi:putative acetyltransferase
LDAHTAKAGLGLAPLAVLPEYHRRGIGSALIRAGLAACRRQGAAWVIVLGNPAYYGRFGFAPASRWQLSGEFGGGDAFGFLPLACEASDLAGGLARYAPEFRELIGDEE